MRILSAVLPASFLVLALIPSTGCSLRIYATDLRSAAIAGISYLDSASYRAAYSAIFGDNYAEDAGMRRTKAEWEIRDLLRKTQARYGLPEQRLDRIVWFVADLQKFGGFAICEPFVIGINELLLAT